jgi:hypothetical protein
LAAFAVGAALVVQFAALATVLKLSLKIGAAEAFAAQKQRVARQMLARRLDSVISVPHQLKHEKSLGIS